MTEFKTARQRLIDFVRMNGYALTLDKIMKTEFACEYRRLFTELRREGWVVSVELDREHPAQNLYRFIEPEPSGQMRIA